MVYILLVWNLWRGGETILIEQVREILEGDFTEGSHVTVRINEGTFRRKVFWDNKAKDLCITINNKRYWYCEFWNK